MPQIPVPFPIEGLNENANYSEQPGRTTSDMLNVRGHDAILGRLRGGRREGLSKYFASPINGDNPIQHMIKAVRPIVFDPDTMLYVANGTAGAERETMLLTPDGTKKFGWEWGASPEVNGIGWDGTYLYAGGDRRTIGLLTGNVFKLLQSGTDTLNALWTFDIAGADFINDVLYSTVTKRVFCGGTQSTAWPGSGGVNANMWALDRDTGTAIWSALLGEEVMAISEDASGTLFAMVRSTTGGTIFKLNEATGAVLASWASNNDSTTDPDQLSLSVRKLDGRVIVAFPTAQSDWPGSGAAARNIFTFDNDLVLLNTYNILSGSVGLRAEFAPSGSDFFLAQNNTVPAASQITRRAGVGGTVLWTFGTGATGVSFVVTTVGELLVVAGANAGWTGSGGNTANFWRLSGSSGSVLTFVNNANIAPGSKFHCRLNEGGQLFTRESSLMIVSGGNIKRLTNGQLFAPTGGNAALISSLYRVQGVQAFNRVFYIDGVFNQQYNLLTDTVIPWVASAGSLPLNTRLIARYRGRIVLAGSVNDPSNWFMSRVADPFDWNYSPATPSALQAVAGNVSEAGLVGDIVTALIPFSDDVLIFGGDQTIWQMAGDPAAGGSIDMVSDDTGIVWNAWVKDPDDVCYFVGIDGVYTLRIGEKPVSLTENRLDAVFDQLDLQANRILLMWDYIRKGLILIVAPVVGGDSVEAFFWSKREDAWHRDAYVPGLVNVGPTAVYGYDAESADDKVALFGGRDSFIRQIDPAAIDDDGNAVSNRVRYPPIAVDGGASDVKMREVLVLLAKNSGTVTLRVFAGQTAEECATATTPRFKRTLKAGRNIVGLHRVQAPWVQVELSQTDAHSRWAVEAVFLQVEGEGRPRRLNQ